MVRWCIAALSMTVLIGCGSVEPPPGRMTIVAAPQSAAADGSAIRISIEAFDGNSNPGQGEVFLRVSHGQFKGSNREAHFTPLENGKLEAFVSCDEHTDRGCGGEQLVRALWNGVSAYTTVTFNGSAPAPDAGAAAQDAGN